MRRGRYASDPEANLRVVVLRRRRVLLVGEMALSGAGERSAGAVQIRIRRARTPAERVSAITVGHPAPTRTCARIGGRRDGEREQLGRWS